METIDEEVFEDAVEELNTAASTSDITSCSRDNLVKDTDVSTDEGDIPSEAVSSTGMRSVGSGQGSWGSGNSSMAWSTVNENYPQLQLMVGFLKVMMDCRLWFVCVAKFINKLGEVMDCSYYSSCKTL